MSWQEINRFELQAIRKLLMLDVSEAAQEIGNVSLRSWQYWESGERPIPNDVNEEMYAMVSMRNEAISDIIEAKQDDDPQKWYPTFEQFLSDYPNSRKLWWRLHQSVVSFLFCEGGDIELSEDIEVDKESAIYKFFARTRPQDIEHQRQEEIFERKMKEKENASRNANTK